MSVFPSIRIEGGLLGPDILEQVLAGDLPGQKPRDFGLDGKRGLTDEIAAVFADARAQWEVFQRRLERLPADDPATSVTRDAWMIPFLSLLGYELRYNPRAYEVDGLTFAISHRAGEAEDAPPVHIVGARQELGRLAPAGRPRLAPHSLLQEFLNRSEQLWGIVTNGLILRLLRDCTYVRRQAYVEFDLQRIFEEQRFNDFAVLYRLLHRSRLPRSVADAKDCLLERYHQHALEQGGRVREHLRDGVEECIKRLGNGFLAHPANQALRQRVMVANGEWRVASGEGRVANGEWRMANSEWRAASGEPRPLSPGEFYHQLLRLVYRLLFLLVSEDRGLISTKALYREHYGVARLRRLVDRRSAYSEHDDIWCSLRVLWKVLSDEKLAAFLGAPPLNGELFEPLDLDDYTITNRDFLEAFWHLAYYRESPSAPPRRVNYAALDVEELGSVYESLLDYHPQILAKGEGRMANGEGEGANGEWRIANGVRFDLVFGSERKSTGSYYTPPELVAELVRSALDPVIAERLAEARRMANGEQRMANGEWRMANGEWRMASGEWRMVPKAIQMRFTHEVFPRLSRPGGLETGHGHCAGSLPAHAELPKGRALRPDQPDPTGSGLDSGEHRRGLGAPLHSGVHSVPPPGQREPDRIGDTAHPQLGNPPVSAGSGSADPRQSPGDRQATEQPGTQPPTEEELALAWSRTPFAIRYSLFAEHALLSLRILDPACGSGHFLLAAARRLGKELARIRTGEDEPAPERVREATRDVVAHCIYGVDKNPLAVELCRVALWLEAHCEGKPLTFLDHRIRCGDSLVGVFDLAVLETGIPDEAFEPASADEKAVANLLKKRNREERRDLQQGQLRLGLHPRAALPALAQQHAALDAIADDSPAHVRNKKELFERQRSDREHRRLREACDLWTAAFFQRMANSEWRMASGEQRAEGEGERMANGEWRMANSEWRMAHGEWRMETAITTQTVVDRLAGRQNPQAQAKADALARQHRFFHWPLEFPEVFVANSEWRMANGEANGESRMANGGQDPLAARHSPLAGFDVVLGNPPFMGGLKVSGTLGDRYRRWLEAAYTPYAGTADLCAAFYRRVFSLLKPGGRLGMVATNTIGQGDTRESGLAPILANGGVITFARRFIKWPGAANVEVNLVALYKPHHSPFAIRHSPILDGNPVPFISSRLDPEPEQEPNRLPQNEGKAFQGDIVRGLGFVLEPVEAEALLAKDPQNRDCLFPYLNGEDLNSHPEQKPSRWVICFHDWPLERARQYPDLLRIVEERVKPERERLRGPGDKRNREFWWQFGAYRTGMRQATAPLRRVLVISRVTEHHAIVLAPARQIFADRLVVFAFDDFYHFALLQSLLHEIWARRHGFTLESRYCYAPSDAFDTFPFPLEEYRRMANGEWRMEVLPEPFRSAAEIGAEYHEHRRQIMLARNIGLTKTYNLFHDPGCTDADIQRLRELHAEMDCTILACYGWDDLDCAHGFCQNERGQARFTMGPAARREILRRLLSLNLRLGRGDQRHV
jgi:hypothetical protein